MKKYCLRLEYVMNVTVNEWNNNQTDSFCCGLATRKVQQFRALCARMRSRCCRWLSPIESRTTISTNEKWTRGKIASHVVTLFICLYSFFHAHRRFWKYLWVRDHWVKHLYMHSERTHSRNAYICLSRASRSFSERFHRRFCTLFIWAPPHAHTHT